MNRNQDSGPWLTDFLQGIFVLLVALLTVVACSQQLAAQPSSSPASASPSQRAASQPAVAGAALGKADSQAEWDRAVAAARQEGKLTITIQPGQGAREWVTAFEKAYPGIQLGVDQAAADAFFAKVVPERQSGKYLWDMYVGGPDSGLNLKGVGALDPFQPAVLLPEVLNDANWLGGFDAGFIDRDGKYVYDIEADMVPTTYINRELIPEAQFSQLEDVVDPKWKGKTVMYEPRTAGKGSSNAGSWLMVMGDKGEAFWRQVLASQPVITEDRRQQLEWVIRGQHPIGIFASNTTLVDFQKQGLGLNVKPLTPNSPPRAQFATAVSLGLLNKAPHPNAAKIFLNWILSHDGQVLYAKALGQNGRRLDVTDGPVDQRPDPKAPLPASVNAETNTHFIDRAKEIAKEMLR